METHRQLRDIQSHKLPSGWVINLGFIVCIVNPGWLLYRIFRNSLTFFGD
jgi:uncharacterized membrane protein